MNELPKGFPMAIDHQEQRYYWNGQIGTHVRTSQQFAEYANMRKDRVRRLADGTIVVD